MLAFFNSTPVEVFPYSKSLQTARKSKEQSKDETATSGEVAFPIAGD